MLEVQDLTKSFKQPRKKRSDAETADPRDDGRLFHAVCDVSFKAESGIIVGLLGPNGAGKTTLLRLLSTALEPSGGTARFDGVDVVESRLEVRKKIGFLSGNTGLYGRLSPREMLHYFGTLHGMRRQELERRVDALVRSLDFAAYVDRRCDRLSSGMKQKVSIARTLVHDPAILIFDEPTTGLDVEAAETILELIRSCKAEGKSVLFSTHHMHEVERLCDLVVVLDKGRLCFDGTVAALRTQTGNDHLDKAFLSLIGKREAIHA